MCAKSLKGAKHIREVIADASEHVKKNKEGVLVGGMVSNRLHLSQEDIGLIKATDSSRSSIPEFALSFRSLWRPFAFQTPKGMLFREKEHVIIQTENEEHIVTLRLFCPSRLKEKL